ncbi:uncharacterized protein SCHCODRAFT_02683448 [Schizophyllum commune H4-8]|nr:uncharacterized protein SCHCODRAFT_02683448 [Schizophyllum commune H4-8]KAI5900605.1 hypothetical protein SCHCODRAFT_02683448 [Schizophyllum commune H4-8]
MDRFLAGLISDGTQHKPTVHTAQNHCQRLFAEISDERARVQARQTDQDEDALTAAVDFGTLAPYLMTGRKRGDHYRTQRYDDWSAMVDYDD